MRRGTNALHDADCKVSQTKLNNISICRYLRGMGNNGLGWGADSSGG